MKNFIKFLLIVASIVAICVAVYHFFFKDSILAPLTEDEYDDLDHFDEEDLDDRSYVTIQPTTTEDFLDEE